MKTHCLSEQDLILHYYHELPAQGPQARHLAACPACRERLTALRDELARLPELSHAPDPASGPRMAARITEQLQRRRSNWRRALVASSVAALALIATVAVWPPKSIPTGATHVAMQPTASATFNEDLPDIDFLEDLDLLNELELLSQIEGV